MRIRRRPPLPPPLSPLQTSNSSLQFAPPNKTGEERGKLHPDGDLSASLEAHHELKSTDPNPSDPHALQVLKEGKDSSSSSSPKTLDAQVHNNERTSTGEDMEKNGKARSNIALSIDINNDGGVRERVSNGKKRRPPAVLMEGSRCSRVNGRGWRCSQQTLIGYSLCEHHLGKGRIRSISSGGRVGGQEKRSSAKKLKRKELKARSMSSILDEHDDDDDSVDAMTTAKRGMGLL